MNKTIWSSVSGKKMRLQCLLFHLQSGFNRPVLSSSFLPAWKQQRLKTIEESCCRMISMAISPFSPPRGWKDTDECCYIFISSKAGKYRGPLLSQTSDSDTVPTTAVPEPSSSALRDVTDTYYRCFARSSIFLLAWALLDFCMVYICRIHRGRLKYGFLSEVCRKRWSLWWNGKCWCCRVVLHSLVKPLKEVCLLHKWDLPFPKTVPLCLRSGTACDRPLKFYMLPPLLDIFLHEPLFASTA